MNGYLIPANSKKSQLIFGLFKLRDLIILLTGVLVTLVLLFLIVEDTLLFMVIKLLPLCISLILVMPIAFYHNVLDYLKEVLLFCQAEISGGNQYKWRGWCATSGFDDEKK
jgi:phosphoglycerol transferase MdoB-like AlkP superfamily enzyme